MTGAGAGIAEGLRDAFATADLRRLLVGSAAASVGGWAFMVGLSVYAYQAGGAAAVGLAALVRMLPAGFAAPLAGAVADRRSRRDLLVASCAGRGLALAAIAVAVAAGAPLGVVLALAAVVTILQTAQRPAQAALLALLARTPRELGAANAAWSSLDSAGFVVGALLGGALIAATATTVVLAATAAAFAVASLALERIARPVPADRAAALVLLHHGRLAAGLASGAVLAGSSLLVIAALPAPRDGACDVRRLRGRLRARRDRGGDARAAAGGRRPAGARVRRHGEPVLVHDRAGSRRRAAAALVAGRARGTGRHGRLPARARRRTRRRARSRGVPRRAVAAAARRAGGRAVRSGAPGQATRLRVEPQAP